MEYYSAIKKNEILPFATMWTELECIMLKHNKSIRERQIYYFTRMWNLRNKTRMRFYLIPVRMAKINKTGDNRCWRGCGKRGTLLHCWWECKVVKPLWKTIWRFLKKLQIELPYHPAIVLVGIYPNDTKILN